MDVGIGFDLPWGGPHGLVRGDSGHRLAPGMSRWLQTELPRAPHAFVSWQPFQSGPPRWEDHREPLDRLFAEHPFPAIRGLHHTALNTATADVYERGPFIECANRLIERYGFSWVNEDLGLWSIGGRPLPYPLPPILSASGLSASIRGVRDAADGLIAPFVVEFPGFTDGASIRVGTLDPYDFFRTVVNEAGVRCCLDTGHLLGARWLLGHREPEALLADLDRLPVSECEELHLSGLIVGDRLVDAHHGQIHPLQIELVRRLMPLCPNLRRVTFEDPKPNGEGRLTPAAQDGLDQLRGLTWETGPSPEPVASLPTGPIDVEEERQLERLLFDVRARSAWTADPESPLATIDRRELDRVAMKVVNMVADRRYRGRGTLREMFPGRFADDRAYRVAVGLFLASNHRRAWTELGAPDRPIWEAFGRFVAADQQRDDQARLIASSPDR